MAGSGSGLNEYGSASLANNFLFLFQIDKICIQYGQQHDTAHVSPVVNIMKGKAEEELRIYGRQEEEKRENFKVLTNISQKQQQENVEKRRKNINFFLGRGYTVYLSYLTTNVSWKFYVFYLLFLYLSSQNFSGGFVVS